MTDRDDDRQTARRRFAVNLPARLDEIEAYAEPLTEPRPSPMREQALAELLMPVERLHDRAQALGFLAVAETAAALATLVTAAHRTGGELSAEVRDQLAALIRDLRALARDPLCVSEPPPSEPEAGEEPETARDLLLMVGDDALGADGLVQLEHFGYRPRRVDNAQAVAALTAETAPAAAVIDLTLPRAMAAVSHLAELRPDLPAVVALGLSDDLLSRLAAVRAGARAYLTRPLDVPRLASILDRWMQRRDRQPYRVLVVEDDPALAELYARVLRGAGLEVTMVGDPLRILGPLIENRPDVIVMDIAMPECTGLELAEVIRQRDDFIQTPIVFLTEDSSPDRQMEAARSGGDDYFVKPIKPELLVSSVLARAERARRLASLIAQDSMTGLANHTRTKDMLDVEVRRAKRQNRPLAFAMLDIDHFKKVNDTHGHWVGDTVIKTLAHILRHRLRRTDSVGRYGGEEFAVILPNTDGPTARAVIDEIRVAFKNIRHRGAGGDFSVTFSGGIATLPPIGEATVLTKTADEALYAAKHAGRDRIVLQSP